MIRYPLLCLILLLLPPASVLAQERVPLTIETAGGAAHSFQVEIADTPEARQRGLMFREHMEPDHGMLFVFGRPQRIAMWMKDTPLPLDMLFVGRDGEIKRIFERAVPFSLATIESGRRVVYVLELNGGTVDRLGLAVGDRLTGPAMEK